MATLGKRNTLPVLRGTDHGVYLFGDELGEILLPNRYVPRRAVPGDLVDVFVFLDSEDRLVATTEMPIAEVGEFARLKVTAVNPSVGAFLDWGLSKELLLPYREQEQPVRIGQWVIVYVFVDRQSNRIVASTRLDNFLDRRPANYRPGQPVNLFIADKTPLGFNAIIENSHRGLLYHDRLAKPPEPGQKVRGYIRTVRADGKIDLDLNAPGYRKVAPVQQQIIEALQQSGGRLPFDDDTAPAVIAERFGCSKKAFKQALGALYKKRRIRFLNPGIELQDATNWSPGE